MFKLNIFFFFFFSVFNANAITLTQTEANDILFDFTPLASSLEAGEYFKRGHSRDATLLTVDDIPNDVKWIIYARLSNLAHGSKENITIKIKRQGDGTGAKRPKGGLLFKQLKSNRYTEIFRGKGRRFDIPMRTRVTTGSKSASSTKKIGINNDYGTFDTNIEFKVKTYL